MEGNDDASDLREEDTTLACMTKDDVMSMKSTTLGDVEQFYKAYALVHGFGIRMDALLKKKHGHPIAWQMVCSAQGNRELKYIEQPKWQYEHRLLT